MPRIKFDAGQIIYTEGDIQPGQDIWQSTGGMQQGSIWGHGNYLAPDWSAEWLHREVNGLLARIFAADPYSNISPELSKEAHLAPLRLEMQENTFDTAVGYESQIREIAQRVLPVSKHITECFIKVKRMDL